MAVIAIKDPVYERIILAVMEHFEVNEETLKSALTHHVSYMRWCAFSLAKEHTRLSMAAIAERLDKYPTSARNGIASIRAQQEQERYIKKDIAKISKIAGLLPEEWENNSQKCST